MAENKKRVRPTWAQVRVLEAEIVELKDTIKFYDDHKGEDLRKVVVELQEKLESQIEGTSTLVHDCDLWREKYQDLKKRFDDLVEKEKKESEAYKNLESNYKGQLAGAEDLAEQVKTLKDKNATLEQSNLGLQQGIDEERKLREGAAKDYQEARKEVMRLKNRGFFARLFNF